MGLTTIFVKVSFSVKSISRKISWKWFHGKSTLVLEPSLFSSDISSYRSFLRKYLYTMFFILLLPIQVLLLRCFYSYRYLDGNVTFEQLCNIITEKKEVYYSHDPKEHVARMNIEGWKFQRIFKHIGQKCSKWTYRVLLSLNYWQVMFNKNHFLLLKWSKTAKSYWIQ